MTPLQPDPDGVKVLTDWLERCHPSQEDQDYVKGVLNSVENRDWGRWFHRTDLADSDITIYEPRTGLLVSIQLWAGENQFALVRIIDEGVPEG
jgi:hypothetical protein